MTLELKSQQYYKEVIKEFLLNYQELKILTELKDLLEKTAKLDFRLVSDETMNLDMIN